MMRAQAAIRHPARDRRQMMALQAVVYPVFLIVALVGWLLPKAGGDPRTSAFAEAAELTHSVIPWFFVGR